ncbi:MAG: hypothetical protein KF789_11260 [Bdellovibrionaceae bacterium]|nr:hypothetical protein [Pseudobdellovibrionaceae bacterium]
MKRITVFTLLLLASTAAARSSSTLTLEGRVPEKAHVQVQVLRSGEVLIRNKSSSNLKFERGRHPASVRVVAP